VRSREFIYNSLSLSLSLSLLESEHDRYHAMLFLVQIKNWYKRGPPRPAWMYVQSMLFERADQVLTSTDKH